MLMKKIDNPLKLLEYMQDIEYGYVDLCGKKHATDFNNIQNQYRLRDYQDIEKSKMGTCWDQVETERHYFEQLGIKYSTYLIVYYDEKDYCLTHTFLVYYDKEKVYWFENSFFDHRGIHEYNDLESLIKDVRVKFMKIIKPPVNEWHLCLYQYLKPKTGIKNDEFFRHCEKNGPLDLLWAK